MARQPVNPLDALGRSVSEALDAYAPERQQAIELARQGFLEARASAPHGRTRRTRTLVSLAAAAAILVTAGAYVERTQRPLTFVADGQPASRETWLAATGAPLPLDFSDGTRLRLEPSSRVRVLEVDRNGASLALENGAIQADVVHRSKSAWRVIAGPLIVRVTGTRFELRWSAATEEFSVSVREGSVSVSGAIVGSERPVRAGETLRVRVGEKHLALTNSAEVSQPLPRADGPFPAQPLVQPGPQAPSPAAAAPVTPSSTTPQLAPREDWRELARRGLSRKAFSAAEASGFDGACQTATAAELLQLGDAARLSGRPERARQALLALRTRYPTDPRRAAAAFALGKVAFDQAGAFAQAAEWFSTSLREQPNGSLSREAAGRLIEAYQRAGNTGAARKAARDYLARYPDGPHADVARSIVR